LLGRTLHAGTLDVPAQYPTIQAAIVAAQPGDTVLVAPGRYLETIDFLGKAITVQSSGGAAVTTIDGGSVGSVVTFKTNETQASVLRGFEITGGTGSPAAVLGSTPWMVGGGLIIVSAGPTIEDCEVRGNLARDMGGGVFLRGNGPNGTTFKDCVIVGNATTGPSPSLNGGGGVGLFDSHAALKNCQVTSNTSHGSGGGLDVPWTGSLSCLDCLISSNSAAHGGGGFAVELYGQLSCSGCVLSANHAAFGGAGHVSVSQNSAGVTLAGCDLTANVADGSGGALNAYLAADSFFGMAYLFVTNCRVLSNVAQGAGGGLYVHASTFSIAEVENSLIAGNAALGGKGGGLWMRGLVSVGGCTVTANHADEGGGLWQDLSGNLVRGSIFWANEGGQIAGTSSANLAWCDVEGGYSGTSNIDVDPHFADPEQGDFHLAQTSACVDAGNPSITSSSGTDIDGDPRVLFGRVDIGADEATIPNGPWTFLGHALVGASGPPSLVGLGTLTPGAETTLSLSGAAASSPTWLVAGAGQLVQPFQGGVMVPTLDLLVGPIATGESGSLMLSGRWPNGIPPGFVVSLQSWIGDAAGPEGFAASNGLAAQSQ
jgi:hypothetical protein